MNIMASLQRNEPKLELDTCVIKDIVEVFPSTFEHMKNNLMDDQVFIEFRKDMMYQEDGINYCILALDENSDDGILIQSQGRMYAFNSAFIPQAKTLVKAHIKQLADYIISEGTEHTEDGKWSNTYDELYYHFGGQITDKNGNGKLLKAELEKRDEVNELIMTEDCIEMTYHLEYCHNCQQSGVQGAMSLFSLMGCNLYNAHLEPEYTHNDTIAINELSINSLTEEGKAAWDDVLNSTVAEVSANGKALLIKLTDCDTHRVEAFAKMMNGMCDAEDYDRWVMKKGVVYQDSVPDTSLEEKYSAMLVATYEELLEVPVDEQTTAYFGDLSIHHFRHGMTEEQIRPVYLKALETLQMTEDEFLQNKDLNSYRWEMIAKMRDNLLVGELKTGEEVLFVNSEPIAGEDEFGYKSGIVMSVDAENKTCHINGTYFSMENVPLHNVLGRWNENIRGMHYGYRNVEPLFGENRSVAQYYIHKSKTAWEQSQANRSSVLSAVGQKDFEIICAQHVLFMNGLEGGKQADFSGRIFEEMNFSSKDLINMNFDGSKFLNCVFEHSDISYSSFDGTKFYDCKCNFMTANNASFRKAEFDSCELDSVNFSDCNFSYAEFNNNDEPETFENCCTHKLKLSDDEDWDECFIDCIDNEKEWAAEMSGQHLVL